MTNNSIDVKDVERKNCMVDEAVRVLKSEFIGIDRQIDEIMDNVRTWFIYPQLQSRPLVVNLFGMSGIGKTSLVKRISELLDIEKDYVYFNFASINESTSWEIENSIREELSNEKSNRMFVYDEFQYAATLNPKSGEERDNKSGLKPFWELLDSGIIHKRGDFWSIRMPYKVIECMARINDRCRMVIKKGVWVNSDECLSYFEPYDISHFSDILNFEYGASVKKDSEIDDDEDGDECAGSPKPKEGWFTEFFIKEYYLDKIIDLYESASGCICDRIDIYHRLESMSYDELMEFICSVYENAKKGYDLKFNDSIIFVIGNLDEAYEMSFDVNPDMSPDQFRKITEKISVVDIKDALKSRFRNEQIARLGNIHVIYPSFSEQNFRDIIEMSLAKYGEEAFSLSGYRIDFDDSIKKIIYDEGVYPTHGTRPIFSTVHEIVKSKFPNIIRYIYENGIKDSVSRIRYSFDESCNNVVASFIDAEGTEVASAGFKTKLRLKKLRESDTTNDEQALCALHESGHFVMYAKLFGRLPEKLVSRSADSNTGGFMMDDIEHSKKKVSKIDLLNEIRVLLGGYVAEKYLFGNEMSMGASRDLHTATQIASKIVRRYGMGNETFVTSNTTPPDDMYGYLVCEDNQNYINAEIKNIIQSAEDDVRNTLSDREWRAMLKESAMYLCENSSMPKEKMAEIYDKVSDSVKLSVRNENFYRDMIMTL